MTEGPSIKLLSDVVANKIAAGEVVDRPAAVLKEMIENSLDAGTTQMEVEIVAAGRQLIAVTDNGRGMGRDDALLSIERHATSKIREADDLEKVGTFGFRGEALAAISSVARVQMQSCQHDNPVGTELLVAGGKLQDVRDAGCPPGTRIAVRNLFFNVPARRKFLRTDQTELLHLRQAFIVHALAHPAVGMTLKVDGREVYRLPAGAGLADRIREIFGRGILDLLRPVEYSDADVTVSGYVALPQEHRVDRAEQYTFINRRPATAPLLMNAIKEGYRGMVQASRHPVVFLFLDVAPEYVDVNVHPTKKEVRFRRPGAVRDSVVAAIRDALTHGPTAEPPVPDVRAAPASRPGPTSPTGPTGPTSPTPPTSPTGPTSPAAAPPPAPTPFPYPPVVDTPVPSPAVPVAPPPAAPVAGGEPVRSKSAPWAWCRVIDRIGKIYVLIETDDGYVIMHPAAAHERVLYERMMAAVLGGAVESQRLLVAETIHLPPTDAHRVAKHLAVLNKLGFEIGEFGDNAFVVDALPALCASASVSGLLTDIAYDLESSGGRGASAAAVEEAVIQGACRAAVGGRDNMTREELEQLVIDLAKTNMPYTCPRGRPTLIYTSFRELARKFARDR